MDTLESLAKDGLNKKIVQASVNIKEFELREADFSGLPKGLIFGLYSQSHWMYSDDPIEILEFSALKNAFITSSIWEILLRLFPSPNTI